MDEDEDSDDDGDDDDDAEDNDDNEYRSKDKSDVDYIILPALAPQKIDEVMLVMDMLNIGRWMLGKRVEIFYQVKYVAGLDTEDKQLRCEDT